MKILKSLIIVVVVIVVYAGAETLTAEETNGCYYRGCQDPVLIQEVCDPEDPCYDSANDYWRKVCWPQQIMLPC